VLPEIYFLPNNFHSFLAFFTCEVKFLEYSPFKSSELQNLAQKLWSTITCGWIELGSQCRHHCVRETAPHFWSKIEPTCDIIVTSFCGENVFSGSLGKQVVSIQTAIELKPNTLETNFLHTNVGEDLTFAMMIPKVEIFNGGLKGQKIRISRIFGGSSQFSACRYLRAPLRLQKRCIWVSCNIPSNFNLKYW